MKDKFQHRRLIPSIGWLRVYFEYQGSTSGACSISRLCYSYQVYIGKDLQFKGEKFSPSPMHPIESKEALYDFLSLACYDSSEADEIDAIEPDRKAFIRRYGEAIDEYRALKEG